jgi:hypothetical protein
MPKEKSSKNSNPQKLAQNGATNETTQAIEGTKASSTRDAGSTSQQLRTVSTPAPNRSGKKRARSKANRPQIGGTAVSGAKSTLPRPTSESRDPNQQQIESYNRTMRRRMEHIGAGPYAQEQRLETMKKKRQKKLETQKERRVEAQQELKQSMRGFGKRNLYLFLGTVAVIVLIIVIFVLLRVYHVFG